MKAYYITFEQAKWLKEKGFDLKSKYHYPNLSEKQDICLITDWNHFTDMAGDSNYYTAPEQHQVVEWLRVNHGIWVSINKIDAYQSVYYYILIPSDGSKVFEIEEWSDEECDEKGSNKYYNSPQEAYSAAFDYIKDNNLI